MTHCSISPTFQPQGQLSYSYILYGSIKPTDHWFGWYGCGNGIKLWSDIPLYCCCPPVMNNSIEPDRFGGQLPSLHTDHTEPRESLLMYLNFTLLLWNSMTERLIHLTSLTEYKTENTATVFLCSIKSEWLNFFFLQLLIFVPFFCSYIHYIVQRGFIVMHPVLNKSFLSLLDRADFLWSCHLFCTFSVWTDLIARWVHGSQSVKVYLHCKVIRDSRVKVLPHSLLSEAQCQPYTFSF